MDSINRLDRQHLAGLLETQLSATIHDWLPSVIENLPDELLQTANQDDLLLQIKALLLLQQGELQQELLLSNSRGNRVTVIALDNRPGFLAGLLTRLPSHRPLVSAQIFSSKDRRFIIDVFEFADAEVKAAIKPLDDATIQQYVSSIAQQRTADGQTVLEFLNAIGSHNRQYSMHIIGRQFDVYAKTVNSDRAQVVVDISSDAQNCLLVGMGNSQTRQLLERVTQFLAGLAISIASATCDDILVGSNNPVALLTLRLEHDFQTEHIGPLLRFLSVDDEVIQRVANDAVPNNDVLFHEVLLSMAHLVCYRLSRSANFRVSFEEVVRILERFPAIQRQCVHAVLFRFGQAVELQKNVDFDPRRDTNELTERNVLQAFLELPGLLQKSNLVVSDRQCLAFRVASNFFEVDENFDLPFGIFYVYGNGFDGFHLRFRDVARGGMRLVRTRNREHYLFESQRLFTEVFDLAWAQNLKNKDIPEGGAKAVVMVKPGIDPVKIGRRFVDALLDLTLPSYANLHLYYTDPEYLYLGPDENVTPELIDWIVENARTRGYPFFNTFISSKPKLGINHKQYGVTSEGVIVFLTQCLKEKGIDPTKDRFTVKLTGGPDGDVGGNAIRFLIRDFGERVKIVAVADGSGCAIDPVGLQHTALMRLVDSGQAIAMLNPSSLSKEGSISGVQTLEQQSLRNNLHFRIQSDVFLPCGGRPGSINQFNVEMFFRSNGQPLSEIIVEGANLFITPVARKILSDRGVWVIKDSSANKCGVICSSFEIIAGMLLNDDQFLAIKPDYVRQVIATLKRLAEVEAISLFQERRRQPLLSFPEISVMVSQQIIEVAQVIESQMPKWTSQHWAAAVQKAQANLPASLLAVASENPLGLLPEAYRRQMVSALLASRLVYREGCRNLELMTPDTLGKLAVEDLVSPVHPAASSLSVDANS